MKKCEGKCDCSSNKKILFFSKTRDVKDPQRGTSGSAGIDFFIPNDWNDGKEFCMHPGDSVLIPSGIKVFMPEGYALIAFNKSGIASKKSIDVLACVIDNDYSGEVHINLINVGKFPRDLNPGMKITQFILLPVEFCSLMETDYDSLIKAHEMRSMERGSGGFGSTGK